MNFKEKETAKPTYVSTLFLPIPGKSPKKVNKISKYFLKKYKSSSEETVCLSILQEFLYKYFQEFLYNYCNGNLENQGNISTPLKQED